MSMRLELLAAPRRDVLDKTPFRHPPFIIPDTYKPKWYRLPLDQKIPTYENPDDPVIYTRPKLGRSLHRSFPKKAFDLSPVLDLSSEYNSLHDPHLEPYFRVNFHKYSNLVRDGFVLPFLDGVTCTQAEFNKYREYIRTVMAKEEVQRRKMEDEALKICSLLREQKRVDDIYQRPYLWLLKRMKATKSTRRKDLQSRDDQIDDDDAYALKYRVKENFVRKEMQIESDLDFVPAIRQQRMTNIYLMRELKAAEKRHRQVLAWHMQTTEELEEMQSHDKMRRAHDAEFYRRVARREKRYRKSWAKFHKDYEYISDDEDDDDYEEEDADDEDEDDKNGNKQEVKTEGEEEFKTESEQEVKTEGEQEVKTEGEEEVKTEGEEEVKTEGEQEVKTEDEQEVKTEAEQKVKTKGEEESKNDQTENSEEENATPSIDPENILRSDETF